MFRRDPQLAWCLRRFDLSEQPLVGGRRSKHSVHFRRRLYMNGKSVRDFAIVIVMCSASAWGQQTSSSFSPASSRISNIQPEKPALGAGPSDSRTEVPEAQNGLLSRTLHRGLQDQ